MKTKKIIFILFILIFSSHDSSSQIVSDLAKIQPTGIITLKANNHSNDALVNWISTSYFIDENTNQYSESSDTLFMTGDSIKVLLAKKIGKYTFYKIKAFTKSFADSVTFQVMNKGVPEKYLFVNKSIPNKPILVYIILPNDIKNANVLFVMHGVERNSFDYIQAWKNFSVTNNYVCIAPTFNDTDWPSTRSYNLGNMFPNSTGTGTINPDSIWSFTQILKIHEQLIEELGISNQQYDIWGHSAGAQFVHRFITFKPDFKIRYAIAANAGWYTLPDLDVLYPFGLKNPNFNFDETFLEDLADKKLIIMRGESDTIRDSNLNTSVDADKQGLNRFERALTYFNYASQISGNPKWKLVDVPDTGHDFELMAAAAQKHLLQLTDVKDNLYQLPAKFKLYQNYPNPFNPVTTINFTLPFSGYVELKIYNMLGEEMITLVDEYKNHGNYSVQFNGTNLPSGIYLYRINAGKYSEARKMLLIK